MGLVRVELWRERSIIAEMSKMCLLTSTRIAKRLKVSQSSVVKAIQWLREAGVRIAPLFQPRKMGLKRVVVRIDLSGLGKLREEIFKELTRCPEVYRVFKTFNGNIVAVIDQPIETRVPYRGFRWEVLGIVESFARSVPLSDNLIRFAIEGRIDDLLTKCFAKELNDDLKMYIIRSLLDSDIEKVDWIDLEIADICLRKPEISLKELTSELRTRGVSKTTSTERHINHTERLMSGYGVVFVESLSEILLVFEARSLLQAVELAANPMISQIIYPGRLGRPIVLVRTRYSRLFETISVFEDIGMKLIEIINLRGSVVLSIPTKGHGYSSARSWAELRRIDDVLNEVLRTRIVTQEKAFNA